MNDPAPLPSPHDEDAVERLFSIASNYHDLTGQERQALREAPDDMSVVKTGILYDRLRTERDTLLRDLRALGWSVDHLARAFSVSSTWVSRASAKEEAQ